MRNTGHPEIRYGAELLESCGGGVQVFEPEGEVEFSGGEAAAGDEAEKSVLEIGGKLGKGVAGVSTSDGVELVEAEVVIESERTRRGERERYAGAGGKGGVETSG
jgi:hypothetical protein